MPKKIMKKAMRNLIGIPMIQVSHQLAGEVPAGASRNIIRAGININAANLAFSNLRNKKKKMF